MQLKSGALYLSASDLVGHLYCGHRTALDFAVAVGALQRPVRWDPFLELLRARGASHEAGFVEHLRAQGLEVHLIDGVGTEQDAVDATIAAMRSGVDAIIQAAFAINGWVGRIDVLRRVERPSALGAWSYEAIDTKLARETRAGTLLQLCLYAALLEIAQGLSPLSSHVVVPWSNYVLQTYRMDDYAAYYRRVRRALEDAVRPPILDVYPEPKEHCEVCRWQGRCDERRRADDHLSFVAGITKGQIEELKQHEVSTLAALAAVPLPWPWRPSHGARSSYERVREQARIQLMGRQSGQVEYEWLPPVTGTGLAALPAPSPGDIFFDLEGDPFAGAGGMEFLFGYAHFDAAGQLVYTADWALNRTDEKAAFERFVDFVTLRIAAYPDLHIYHFAPYEPGALKRLMGASPHARNRSTHFCAAGVSWTCLESFVMHCEQAWRATPSRSLSRYTVIRGERCSQTQTKHCRSYSGRWSSGTWTSWMCRLEKLSTDTIAMIVSPRRVCGIGWKRAEAT